MAPATPALSSRKSASPGQSVFRGLAAAFTLVELLVVMAIIVILLAIAVPLTRGLKGAGDMNKAIYDIAGVLENARAYAMANNTYVYIELGEFDASKSDSAAQTAGTGRVALAVVATRDGTRGYNPYTDAVYTDWVSTNYGAANTASNLVLIAKVQHFDNLHLLSLDPEMVAIPDAGSMHRPKVKDATFRLGSAANDTTNSASQTATPVAYPLGSALTAGTYVFNWAIQFDPQGQARSLPKTVESGNFVSNGVPDRLEIILQPANGNRAMPAPTSQSSGNFCALQIDGMTGTTVIYRP